MNPRNMRAHLEVNAAAENSSHGTLLAALRDLNVHPAFRPSRLQQTSFSPPHLLLRAQGRKRPILRSISAPLRGRTLRIDHRRSDGIRRRLRCLWPKRPFSRFGCVAEVSSTLTGETPGGTDTLRKLLFSVWVLLEYYVVRRR